MAETYSKSSILDPATVKDVSEEKKEYYASHGFVPYRVGDSRVKWGAKGQAVREIQGYLFRHRNKNVMQVIRQNYRRARLAHNPFASFFIALDRYFVENR
ncbi:MAG: hypothetical protein K8R90_02345 [Candidatus Cloacimonetes bacterium]|nr:hypothetical protein [Candidatus Cloacimonadota bacterium]